MISLEVDVEAMLEDPTMDCFNVGDSSTKQSDQAAMSSTSKELVCSLEAMKISS